MIFTSKIFILFIIITIIIYYNINKKYQWLSLLLASYAFYAYLNYNYIIFLIFTTITTYYIARKIYNIDKNYDDYLKETNDNSEKILLRQKCKKIKKRYLSLGLVTNFGILGFFKYFNLFSSKLFDITGNNNFNVVKQLIIPIGISFYMFQATGYLIDVYRKKYKAEKNIFKYALFVSYFPQIIQGPISRYDELAPQLFQEKDCDLDQMKYGVQLIFWGYFKKLLIADRLSILVTNVIGNYWDYSGSIIFATIIIYGVQIYCDFSGGIDTVSGISQVLGVRLTKNFNQPFLATSVADFWRRWHITLGTWMRDYVFYPLSLSKNMAKINKATRKVLGAKKGKMLTLSISTFIIYIIVGIWHGSSMKYVVFGIWHGILISGALFFADYFRRLNHIFKIKVKSRGWKLFQIIRTLILVSIGRYLSRAESLREALSMLKRTFVDFNFMDLFSNTFFNLGLNKLDFIILIFGVICLAYVGINNERGISIRKEFEKKSMVFQLICVFIFLSLFTYFGIYARGFTSSEFIYMQY